MALEKMKSIRQTYLYEILNKENKAFDSCIDTMMHKGIVCTPEMLSTQYSTIESYFKYPLKTAVMDAVKNGSIKPMMYPKGITANHKIPTSLPFILTGSRTGEVNSVAFIDNWATMDKDTKHVTIDPNKLYCFLEGAFIGRGLYLGFNSIRHNTTIYSEGASIWAQMFTRVLNRDYALNVNKEAYSKVLFLAAKFYFINLLQMKDTDLVFNYAMKVAGNISPITIKRLNDSVKPEDYKDISTFITALSHAGYMIISGLEKLTVRSYVQTFIRTYHNSSLFGLEHLAYFIFAVIAAINRVHINDIYAWDAAIGTKNGDKFYAYIANAVKGY